MTCTVDRWAGAVFKGAQAPRRPEPRQVDHRRHLRRTILTCGVWAVLVRWWQPLWVAGHNRRQLLIYTAELHQHQRTEELRACRTRSRRTVERIPGSGC